MGMFATGQFTIVDVNDSPSFELTAASLVLLADSTGAVSSYANAQTQFKSVEAGRDKTNDWSYFVSGSGGGVTYRDSDDTADRSAIGFADGGLGGVNLLPYSQQFDSATGWPSKLGIAVATNALSAPDGTLTAEFISETAVNSQHYFHTAVNLEAGITYTLSVYAKSSVRSITVQKNNGGQNIDKAFNLSTGTAFASGSGYSDATSHSMIPIVDGWYRCALTFTNVTATSCGIGFLIQNGANATYLGDGTSGVSVWGAQLEVGSTATEYVPSRTTFTGRTSVGTYYDSTGLLKTAAAGEARYSYNPANLAAGPSLLLEAAATNIFASSTGFADWAELSTSVSSTLRCRVPNAIAAPDGSLSATKIIGATSSALQRIYIAVSGATGDLTYSIFAKAGGLNRIGLKTSQNATNEFVFDLGSGSVVMAGNATRYGYESLGDGWWRLSIALTATVAIVPWVVLLDNTNSSTFAGDGSSGIYIWGAQLETGLFPTSYYPTTSGTATRSADTSTSVAQSGTRGLLNITGLTQDSSYLDITARKTGSADVTKRLSLARVSKGADGPALAISATAQGFTFVDGVASPAEQYIGFQAVNYSTDTPVTWYTSTGDYLLNDEGRLHVEGLMTGIYGAGNGELAYMSLAQFGSADQITVTAVCGELSATFMVMRLSKSTAAAGATVGAPAGTTVGGVLAETVRDNASNALTAANTANTNLANKQDKASSDILTISTTDAVRMAGIRVGDLAWDASGARTSGKGLALTPQGLLGHNGTKTTFSIDAVTGNTVFDGTLAAGSVKAGMIEVGAATVSAESASDWDEYNVPYGTNTKTVDGVSFNFVSTGAKVTITACINAEVYTYNTYANSVYYECALWADDWFLLEKYFVYAPAVTVGSIKSSKTTATMQWRGGFNPGYFTLTNINIKIKVTAVPLDLYNNAAGYSLSTGYPGALSITSSLIATENKV